jgi:hypothetical protein
MTMRLTSFLNGAVVCIDDVLDGPVFAAAQALVAEHPYTNANTGDPNLIWERNTYRNPDIANTILWPEYERHRQLLCVLPGVKLYPAGDALDKPLSTIRELAISSGVIGRPGTDWAGIIASIFRYEPGGGLIFHSDAASYNGAFSFYLHEEWYPDWGGFFMFSSGTLQDIDQGHFLIPKPNRLVLIRGGTPHNISGVVSPNGQSRLALSGFFVKPERADEMLEQYLPGLGQKARKELRTEGERVASGNAIDADSLIR